MTRISPPELAQAQRFDASRPALHVVPDDLSHIPGAFECKLSRQTPDGEIAYFEAPAGWLTQRGTPRLRPARKYVWTPNDGEGVKLPSTSSILEAICPKPGVAHWSEERGIEGAVLAVKAGLVHEGSLAADAIALVREHGLGAEAAKNKAAKRGLDLHAINEHYMCTGEPPVRSDHPAEHHGYLRSWVKATLTLKPEPVAVEQLVVHPEDGWAGRLDLRARVGGLLETIDLKTQERGRLYRQVFIQTNLYERAEVRCGGEPADRLRAIVLPASGDWNLEQHSMMVEMHSWQVDAALAYWRSCRPIDSACESQNRAVKAA